LDIWSVGAIFLELVTKSPFFVGDSEIDQLYKIFRVLGTPNENSWPGVSKLKDYKKTFPNWNPSEYTAGLQLESSGVDLLRKMLVFNPACRITAKEALLHPYFVDVRLPAW